MRLTVLESAVILAWVVILLLCFTMAGMVRQLHALTSRQASGAAVPWDALVCRPVPASLGHRFRSDRATVVVFAANDCGACDRTVRALPDLVSSLVPSVEVVVAYEGDPLDLDHLGMIVKTHQGDSLAAFNIPALPFGVVVDTSGRVVDAQPLGSPADLERLLGAAGESATAPRVHHH